MQDIMNRQDSSRFAEIEAKAEVYRLSRDALLDITVPISMAKVHLDLINTINAVHHDVLAMTYAFDDPARSLMRLKRYEGDIFGLITALENLYTSLEPYASMFSATDPAMFLTQFNPANRIRI
jgi:hypothetical protein